MCVVWEQGRHPCRVQACALCGELNTSTGACANTLNQPSHSFTKRFLVSRGLGIKLHKVLVSDCNAL